VNIDVKVIAGARKRMISLEGSLLKVKLLSKPQKGKANEELVGYIADTFDLKRRDVSIIAGERDTGKVGSLPLDGDGAPRVLGEKGEGEKKST
jgi:uncharacterized protein (TIGR00251 family)